LTITIKTKECVYTLTERKGLTHWSNGLGLFRSPFYHVDCSSLQKGKFGSNVNTKSSFQNPDVKSSPDSSGLLSRVKDAYSSIQLPSHVFGARKLSARFYRRQQILL
jgi:hypothetical protein